MASDYSRKEVDQVMNDCKKKDRTELIKKQRNNKNKGGDRKYVLCSKWDPRQPNVKQLFYIS